MARADRVRERAASAKSLLLELAARRADEPPVAFPVRPLPARPRLQRERERQSRDPICWGRATSRTSTTRSSPRGLT